VRSGEGNVRRLIIHRHGLDYPNAAELLTNGIARQRACHLHRIGGKTQAQRLELIDGVEHRNEDTLDEGRHRLDKVPCAIR
jgi:hypothetical protein